MRGFIFHKDRAWRMMVDGAGSHYPSEVEIARITKAVLLSFRAKRATEHRFPWLIYNLKLKSHPSQLRRMADSQRSILLDLLTRNE